MNQTILDPEAVKKNFNRAASTFQNTDHLHNDIANQLLSRLEYIKIQPQIILDAGSRLGSASRQLKKHYPKSDVIALDPSPSFLHAMPKPWWHFKTPKAVCGEITQLPLSNQSVDFIFSNLFLHWVNDIEHCFREFKRILKPNGLLLFSLFGLDTLKELRQSFAHVDTFPHVHPFVDMHDIGDALIRSRFADPVMDMECITLNYAKVESLLQNLKLSGSSNAYFNRSRGLMSRRRWQQMIAHYETQRKNQNLPATFEIIYGLAWMPDKTPLYQNNDLGEITIPIDRLRKTYKSEITDSLQK